MYLWSENSNNLKYIDDWEFAKEVNKINAGTINVCMEQCNSGGFIDNLEADNRVIVTACKHDEGAEAMPPDYLYSEFTYHWISAVTGATPDGTNVDADTNNDGFVSMREAFDYAESHDTRPETPQYSSTPYELGEKLTLLGILPTISGQSTICNQSTYTIANFPTGASVIWSASNNRLQVISGQGTSSAVFKKNGNGSCTIEANISVAGATIPLEKTVWVGVPAQPTTNPSGYPVIELGLHSILTINISSAPGALGGSYIWDISGSIENISSGGNHCVVEAMSYGSGSYSVKSTNNCGTSVSGGGGVYVVQGGGGPKSVNLYPNPSDNCITVDITYLADKINTVQLENNNYQIQLWQSHNLIKTINTKSLKTEIPISSLKQGYYYVVVIIKGKKYKQHFFKE